MSGLATAGTQQPVWIDGKLVAWECAQLHVASFGLNNASCVFEGIRVYDRRPFALADHCARLCSSAQAIGMDLPHRPAEIEKAVLETVSAAGYGEAYVRPVAWHGDEFLGISSAGASVHLAIAVLPWRLPTTYQPDGVRLALSRWARPAPNTAPVTAKASCNYVIGALAHREAIADGFDDALLLDYRGFVAEATGANIFMVRSGILHTPIADAFLAGITRRCVLRLATEIGIEVAETRIRLSDLREADELFLTGTASEVQSVSTAGTVRFPDERPVTSALAQAYRNATRQR